MSVLDIEPAPVLLFTYKRLETLKATVNSLIRNPLATETELFIFSDGPKVADDKEQVDKVRFYLREIRGFKNIFINQENVNKGLARSIIEGVSKCLNKYNTVIVVEDDLLLSSNFLSFMNSALNFYAGNKCIFSISGYVYPFKPRSTHEYDTFLVSRGCSWGWATWKDRWERVDWKVSDYSSFKKNKDRRKHFAHSGTDLNRMLDTQMKGVIDSWAVRWYYHQSNERLLTVYPTISKVLNTGFDEYATHTRVYNRYVTNIDDTGKNNFNFINDSSVDPYYQKLVQRKFSLWQRLFFGRFLTLLIKVKTLLVKGGKR